MLVKIVEIQLDILAAKAREKGLEIQYTDELKKYLAERGFDPEYGARPVKRLIQREIGNLLSNFILKGNYTDGQKISVALKDGKVTLST